jgi:hypothetical protein
MTKSALAAEALNSENFVFDIFCEKNRSINNLLDSDSENEEFSLIDQHLDSLSRESTDDGESLTKN